MNYNNTSCTYVNNYKNMWLNNCKGLLQFHHFKIHIYWRRDKTTPSQIAGGTFSQDAERLRAFVGCNIQLLFRKNNFDRNISISTLFLLPLITLIYFESVNISTVNTPYCCSKLSASSIMVSANYNDITFIRGITNRYPASDIDVL